MPYIRYSQWTGTGAPSHSAERIFEGLNEHLNNTGDLQQAMRRLIQRGMGEGEERVSGLDDLLSKVAREMRRLYERYQLRSALDQVREKLESIVK